jgi:hypothetical protein
MTDYLKFYDLERYLLEEIGPRFRATGVIEPVDFFMIFIWKANRAKTTVRDGLKSRAAGSFETAVVQIAASLYAQKGQKERLQVLMQGWRLKLPMASAILTVLYQDEFTVYDSRVCQELGFEYRPQREFSDALWVDYESYREAVIKATPATLKQLRDRDRFLWGRSLRKDAERDFKM